MPTRTKFNNIKKKIDSENWISKQGLAKKKIKSFGTFSGAYKGINKKWLLLR